MRKRGRRGRREGGGGGKGARVGEGNREGVGERGWRVSGRRAERGWKGGDGEG